MFSGWLQATVNRLPLQLLFLTIGCGIFALFLELGEILAAPADEPSPTDLLVILGGGVGDRVVKAFELLDNQQAGLVLITGVWKGQVIDRFKSYDYRIEYLERRGISRDRIHIDATAASTWEEAFLVHQFMLAHRLNSATIVSDPPHMWRLSWVYRRVFKEPSLSYHLVATEPNWWNSKHWWKQSESGVFVLKEIVKIIYYWLRYER